MSDLISADGCDVRMSPAFELRAGDEIRMHCVYQSLTRTDTTFYGEATSDEMCFGLLMYYPAVSEFTYCGQWRAVDECSNEAGGYICDFEKADPLWDTLQYLCAGGCSSGCVEALKHLNTTGCMSGDAGEYLLHWYPELQHVVNLQRRCVVKHPVKPVSNQAALQPFWSICSTAFLATSLVIRFAEFIYGSPA